MHTPECAFTQAVSSQLTPSQAFPLPARRWRVFAARFRKRPVPSPIPLLCGGLHQSRRDHGHNAIPTVCDVEELAIGPQRHAFRMPTDGDSSDD